MGKVVGLAFVSALNPALVAATTIMLLLPRPQRLMLGYWFGAMLTSVTLGVVIVFTLEGSGFEQSSKNTVHPAIALTLAGLLLLVVLVLATGRDKPFEERRRTRKEQKESPRWQRWMQKGDPKITFVIGVLLSFPGASYLVALDTLSKLHYSTLATVLVVIGFCLVELVVLEILLVAFMFAPGQTPVAIDRAKAWAGARWRTIAIWGVAVIAAGLAVNGIAELL
jgi:Sap, sulfolipid-1-addressing protein